MLITEFLAKNDRSLADGNERYSDWIELHNAGDTRASLDGWYLTDDPESPLKWPFPDGFTLDPGAYDIIFASSASDDESSLDPTGNHHASFSLAASGEFLALVDGTGVTPVIVSQFADVPAQSGDISYGIERLREEMVFVSHASPVRVLVPADDSVQEEAWTGASEPFDDSEWIPGTNRVGYDTGGGSLLPDVIVGHWPLNDAEGAVADDQSADDGAANEHDGTLRGDVTWRQDVGRGPTLELDGRGAHVSIADHDDLDPQRGAFSVAAWINVEDASIRQEIVGKQGDAADNYAGWAFRISQSPGARNLNVMLNADNGANRIDVAGSQTLTENVWHHVAFSYDGSGKAEGVSLFLDGERDADAIATGELTLPVATDVDMAIGNNRGQSGQLPFHGGIDDVSIWKQSIDDVQIMRLARGDAVASLFGYESLIDFDLEKVLSGQNASTYIRIPFHVDLEDQLDDLTLHVNYDDGFIAYLDGLEVARRNAPAVPTWNSASLANRPNEAALRAEAINLSAHVGALTPGEHVLAIHALNDDVTSSQFLVASELRGTISLGTVEGYFPRPTPMQPNHGAKLGFVSDVRLSVDRGFYDSPFHVTLESATSDATIWYTTDGSVPTATQGTAYGGPILIDRTTTLRAVASKPNLISSPVATRTYLFRQNVLGQTRPDGFPTATIDPNHMMDYEVDPRISQDPTVSSDLEASLVALPSVSVVMDFDDLFDTATGIYPNSTRDGSAWQRPASVEWIDPTGGDEFQVDVGINVSGRSSRTWSNTPKHNFRLKFSSQYGPTTLKFPLFEDSPVDEFDQLVIRSPVQDSWTTVRLEYRENAQYSVDRWMRQVYRDMGHTAGYGRFAHLYLNGLYWGIYEVAERPNSEFAASHLGGDPQEYDALNAGAVKDGDAAAWNEMHQIANGRGSFGAITNPSAYDQLQEYLDVESFADYVILNVYGANIDWPHNNYWAVRRRDPGGKFQFIPWDSEHPLWHSQWNRAEFGNQSALDYNVLDTSRFRSTNAGAGYLYQRLKQNDTFRLLMADRLRHHLTYGGVLTPEFAAHRFQAQLDHVAPGMMAESARWGDAWGDSPIDTAQPYSRDVDWADASDWLINEFFPGRTQRVLEQFAADGIDPGVPPPKFNQHGGNVAAPFPLDIRIEDTFDVSHRAFVSEGASVSALVPKDDSLDAVWFAEDYLVDANWTDGVTGVGYRDGSTASLNDAISMDLQDAWDLNESSVYTRIEFEADSSQLGLGSSDRLLLRMQYDDGFVAYLNGVEVARSGNVPAGQPTFNTRANVGPPRSVSAVLSFVDFDITSHSHLLHDPAEGPNLLAIHGLNASARSNDLFLLPELVSEIRTLSDPIDADVFYSLDGSDPRLDNGELHPSARSYAAPIPILEPVTVMARVRHAGVWSALTIANFTVDPPLAVTEIMYHPATEDALEFIELRNTSANSVALNGIRLDESDEGIEFTFADEAPLEPGEYIIVVRDRAAFERAYGIDGRRIANGQFERDSALSNGGETITLRTSDGRLIQQFAYQDHWYRETDGGGYSLVVSDTMGDYEAAANWNQSVLVGGSPGTSEPVPFDANLDGVFDSEDFVHVFQIGKFGTGEPARWEEGDWDGDGDFDFDDLAAALEMFEQP